MSGPARGPVLPHEDPLLRDLACGPIDSDRTLSASNDLTQAELDPLRSTAREMANEILAHTQVGPPTRELQAGVVLGNYRLLELVGSGGMSTVFLAEHVAMKRRVAVKVLLPDLAKNKRFVERFYREAQAAARLDHPHVVKVHDIISDGDVHYLVMEYIEGKTIQQMVADSGPLDTAHAADYLHQTVDALVHAHRQGIVHRDIKPDNLFVDKGGLVKVLDLGLARLDESEDNRLLTVHDTMLGTVDYIAPEQAENSHEVDARADIYSLGCTFYFMLAGHPPFPTGTPAQRLMFHMLRQPTKLSTMRNDVPAALEDLLAKMMAKSPSQRCQSMLEVAQSLAELYPPTARHRSAVVVPTQQSAAGSPSPSAVVSAQAAQSAQATAPVAQPPAPGAQAPAPVAQAPAAPTPITPLEAAPAVVQPAKAPPAASQTAAPPVTPSPAEVRVTLGKLLDLRDGLLEAPLAEAIRKKVAAVGQIQQIQNRIEESVARPWLESPVWDDVQADPNLVAAYLDDEQLDKGSRTGYERLCVEGDAYLAEVADCHAIRSAEAAGQTPTVDSPATLRSRLVTLPQRHSAQQAKVQKLITGLTDHDPFVRELAAEALGKLGPGASAATESLLLLINDRDTRVKTVVREALRKIRGSESRTNS